LVKEEEEDERPVLRCHCGDGFFTPLCLFGAIGKNPNICQHFRIPCMSLEEFMEGEGWVF
jgi:hypothetical protein